MARENDDCTLQEAPELFHQSAGRSEAELQLIVGFDSHCGLGTIEHPSRRCRAFCVCDLAIAEQDEGERVSTEYKKSPEPLVHVHVCVHCGGATHREMFEDRAHTTGVYPCPRCGKEGPLNIAILEAKMVAERDDSE